MKKLWITALAALAVTATSCSNEDDFLTENLPNETNRVVLSATISDGQGDTRSTFDIDEANKKAQFLWSTDDAITVFSTDNTNQKFTLKSGSGTKKGTFEATGATVGELAYYPYHAEHTTTTFVLPATYGATGTDYVEDTHAAYSATIAEGKATFTPLAGLLQVKFESVPTNVTQFVLTADQDITGTFTITEGKISTGTPTNPGKTVKFLFNALDNAGPMTFYIPLPVGTYNSFKTELKDASENVVFTKTYNKPQEIQQGKLTAIGSLSSPDYTVSTESSVTTYTVYTAAGLQTVMQRSGIVTHNITLAADIDLTDAPTDGNGSNLNQISSYFGVFDGQGHSIKGLKVIRPLDDWRYNLGGLVNYLYGTIQNTTLVDCTIQMDDETSQYVGAFAGGCYGTIDNCIISGTSEISGAGTVGGLVGYSREYNNSDDSKDKVPVIKNSKVTGSVTIKAKGTGTGSPISSGAIAGGIVGQIKDEGTVSGKKIISNCQVTDGVTIEGRFCVGGIAGEARNSNVVISDCVVDNVTIISTGKTPSYDAYSYSTGGIVGHNAAKAVIKNCKSSSTTINAGNYRAGGIVGYNGGYVIGCVAENSTITGVYFVGGIAGLHEGDIIASYANGISLKLTGADTQVANTIGGIAGINAYEGGATAPASLAFTTLGCYAYNCKYYNGSSYVDFTDGFRNVVGYYDFTTNPHKTRNYYYTWAGALKASYYYPSSGANVTPVTTTAEGVVSSGTPIAWGDTTTPGTAVYLMNEAIKEWNDTHSNTCEYRWGGDSPDKATLAIPTTPSEP